MSESSEIIFDGYIIAENHSGWPFFKEEGPSNSLYGGYRVWIYDELNQIYKLSLACGFRAI